MLTLLLGNSKNGGNEMSAQQQTSNLSNGLSDRLSRCFATSSHCCPTPKSNQQDEEECYENGASASTEKLEAVAAEAQRQLSLHRNCGCDDHAHHHRGRKTRPKTASSPTQTEQVSYLLPIITLKIRLLEKS